MNSSNWLKSINVAKETLNADDFLKDVATNLRRNELKTFLSDRGTLTDFDVESLLEPNEGGYTNVDCSWTGRVLSSKSFGVNFAEQKINAVFNWWKSKNTDNKKESLWERISREGSKTPKSSSKLPVLSKSTNLSTTPPCNTPEKNVRSLTEQEDFSDSENMKKKQKLELNTSFYTRPVLNSVEQQTRITTKNLTDEINVNGTDRTLEENLRDLCENLMYCGRKDLIEKIQNKWIVGVDVNRNYADMRHKTAPSLSRRKNTLKPKNNFYPIKVVGRSKLLDSKHATSIDEHTSHTVIGRGSCTSLTSIYQRGNQLTAFEIQKNHKPSTYLRLSQATIEMYVMVDDVAMPDDVMLWMTSQSREDDGRIERHVREKFAHKWCSTVVRKMTSLEKFVDELEHDEHVIVDTVRKRSRQARGYDAPVTPCLVVACRCLHLEGLQHLWMNYCNKKLGKLVQNSLFSVEANSKDDFGNVKLKTTIFKENYNKALRYFKPESFFTAKSLNNILKTKSKNFENISPSRNGEPRITHYMMLNNININDIQKRSLMQQRSTARKIKLATNILNKSFDKRLVSELDKSKKLLKDCEEKINSFFSDDYQNLVTLLNDIVTKRLSRYTEDENYETYRFMNSVYDVLYANLNAPSSIRQKSLFLLDYRQCPAFKNDYDLIRKQKEKELVYIGLFKKLMSLMDSIANVRACLQNVVKKWSSHQAVGSVKVEKLILVKDVYEKMEKCRRLSNIKNFKLNLKFLGKNELDVIGEQIYLLKDVIEQLEVHN